MPSYLHEALLDLFRNDLSLALSLLVEEFGIACPELAHMRAEPCDFTDIGPKEFRGDLALSTHDARDRPVLGVCGSVVQPQVLGPDRFPLVTDPTEALRCPERAVLSAMSTRH